MGKEYTEAQKKASLTYQRSKAQIKITTEKEQRDAIKRYAESKGVSVTELFLNLVKEDMLKNYSAIHALEPERLPENIAKLKIEMSKEDEYENFKTAMTSAIIKDFMLKGFDFDEQK